MYVKKKIKTDVFFLYITDNGKMLKYREKYRSISNLYTILTLSFKWPRSLKAAGLVSFDCAKKFSIMFNMNLAKDFL